MARRPLMLAFIAAVGLATRGPAQEILPSPAATGPIALPAPQASAPNPFVPLPEGTVIGPSGPVVPTPPPPPTNAIVLPPLDAEMVWQRLVDVVDDYFKIASEQRVVFSNGVPAEGRIDTFPQTGSTLLEPWRGDSVGFRERLEATLQSIRRVGTVRLIPDPAGWRVEAVVQKELENMPRPMMATTGGASFRNDDSLYRYGTPLPTLGQQVGDQPRPVAAPTPNLGWIPLGRDPLLEQRILSKLQAKLGIAAMPSSVAAAAPPPGLGVQGTVPPAGPVFGAPIPPEQLPPGAVIAPGPPVPVESLPVPQR
ncbi:MAG: hypothetical protein RLZZ111_196 [Planctomycetota bacterium]